jgi:hypothetical protein
MIKAKRKIFCVFCVDVLVFHDDITNAKIYQPCGCYAHQECYRNKLKSMPKRQNYVDSCPLHNCHACLKFIKKEEAQVSSTQCACVRHTECKSPMIGAQQCLYHFCQQCNSLLGTANYIQFAHGCCIHETCLSALPYPTRNASNCPKCKWELTDEDLVKGWPGWYGWTGRKLSWWFSRREHVFNSETNLLPKSQLFGYGFCVDDVIALKYTMDHLRQMDITWEDLTLRMKFVPRTLTSKPFDEFKNMRLLNMSDQVKKPPTPNELCDNFKITPLVLRQQGETLERIALFKFTMYHFHHYDYPVQMFMEENLTYTQWVEYFDLNYKRDILGGFRISDQNLKTLKEAGLGWEKVIRLKGGDSRGSEPVINRGADDDDPDRPPTGIRHMMNEDY